MLRLLGEKRRNCMLIYKITTNEQQRLSLIKILNIKAIRKKDDILATLCVFVV